MIKEYGILAQYELEKRKAETAGQELDDPFYSTRQIRDELEADIEQAHEKLRARGVLEEKGGDRNSPEKYYGMSPEYSDLSSEVFEKVDEWYSSIPQFIETGDEEDIRWLPELPDQ